MWVDRACVRVCVCDGGPHAFTQGKLYVYAFVVREGEKRPAGR